MVSIAAFMTVEVLNEIQSMYLSFSFQDHS